MTHQNTKTFSSIGDVLQEKIIEVDQFCEIHNIKLVTAFGKEPLCVNCQKEKSDKKHQEYVEKARDDYERRKTHSWLYHNSIFLDETLKQATFETYTTPDKETADNKEMALQIGREYYFDKNYNTILTGKAGTGKSHLAMSILHAVNENSKPYKRCLFVSLDELMRRIKDSFNNKQSLYTEQRMIDLLTKADLLVLDDLGAETGAITTDKTATDFTTKILYAVINGRMNKPTIITTNLTSNDMKNMYDSKLVSRMFRGAKGHVIAFKETNDKRINIEF